MLSAQYSTTEFTLVQRFVAPLLFTLGVLFNSLIAAPKLIVVISLDQCRHDCLIRFADYYGTEGFHYLMQSRASFPKLTCTLIHHH
jgi:hypothetical protein